MRNILLKYIENSNTLYVYDPIEKSSDPNTELFNGVIMQALIDICSEEEYNTKHHKGAKEEAMAWFFSTIVSVVDNFEMVCDLAGINSSKVRDFAKRITVSDNKEVLRQQMLRHFHD
tara:strand:+ start:584 stop:934 length:351 start_codon:yes stop_codon:yes gene_type:complete